MLCNYEKDISFVPAWVMLTGGVRDPLVLGPPEATVVRTRIQPDASHLTMQVTLAIVETTAATGFERG